MSATRGSCGGFTLIEVGFALVIVAILALIALPSYRDSVDKTRLRSAVEALHADLQHAKTLVQQQKATIVVTFSSGASWCYGITAAKPACACAQSDATQADFCEVRAVRSADVKSVTLAAANFGGNTYTAFEPVRGSAAAGSVTLRSAMGKEATVTVSALGRVSTCSPAGPANTDMFPAC